MKKIIFVFFYIIVFPLCVYGSNDLNQRIKLLEERIAAREKALQKLEDQQLKNARKEASVFLKKTSKTADDRVGFLKRTFDRRKKERDKEFNNILYELKDLEGTVGGKEYDSWTIRQERKASQLQKKLKQERKLLYANRIAARNEIAFQNKQKQKKLMSRFAREQQEKFEHERREGRYFYLYPSPTWPEYARLFERMGFGLVQLGFKGFLHGFVGSGDREDLAKLEYYEHNLKLSDLICECGLLASGTISTRGGAWDDDPGIPELARNPLYVLKDASVALESRRFEIPVMFGGSMGIGDEKTVLSLFFPATYHSRELKVSVTTPSGVDDFGNAALVRYVSDPGALLKEAFDLRSLDFGGNDSGFISANARLSLYRKGEIRGKFKGLIGLTASMPLLAKDGKDSFQQPRLSDAYFPSCGLFLAGVVPHSNFVNPHIFGQVQIFFAKNFARRLGHYKTYSGTGTMPLLMTNFVQDAGSSAFDNVLDSKVSLFAEELAHTTVARPYEIEIVAGNQIREVFGISGFLDLFYSLRIRGDDDVVLANSEDIRQREFSGLLFADQEMEHRVGCDLRYQFNSKCTMNLGILYTLIGQNVPETYEFKATFRAEF
ncbi:hypothetical protein KAU11_02635 [Candidatus Babeliales bacterium]|nr:hypothetical protein [Candidatus Babeliales bacterium]